MSTTTREPSLEERLVDLDSRLRQVEATLIPLPRRGTVRSVPSPPAASASPPRSPSPSRSPSPRPAPPGISGRSLGDVVGGHVLAWLGGIAILLGIVLFLALAISRGWIGVDERLILAGVGSILLLATGVRLHARRGRTEASIAMVGAAVAGMFATLVAGSEVYGVVSPLAAVGASMVVGALATALAIRWAGRAVAVIGLLGALLSPILVGATLDATTVAIVAIGGACAMAAMVARRWNWLGVAAVVACAGLWGAWMLAGQSALADLVVLTWFGGLGLAGAIGMQLRSVDDALRPSAAALVPLNICLVAVLGEVALRHAAGGHAGAAWLAALALVHGAAGAARVRRIAVPESFRRLLLVFAVVLADVAFGLTAGGVVLAAGWGAAAIGFAWCGRRAALEGDQTLVRLGLGAHLCLTLIRVLLSAPPRDLGSAQLVPLLSVAILVGSCLASGFLVGSRDRWLAMALNAAGLTAVAYLTAQTLSGSALVTAWAFEALALSRLAATGRDGVARFGAVGFLALAATHALVIEAPPMALVDGARSLGAAAIALGAIVIAVSLAAVGSDRDARPWLVGGGAAALLYLGSVAIITVFQPAAGVAPDLLALSVRQQGQVLLSACWSLVGVVSLIAGLRRNHAPVRNAALGLLLLTVAKVFLYDLSALTSLYRVVSFIALGLLLLVGAFAYQRLRPPPLPDMRSVHRSQR